jgi:phosphatidylserine/phosphatidylglycerophosphate/cardiolipin synthase-like enzyme
MEAAAVTGREAEGNASREPSIVRPGTNCLAVPVARRAAILVDGDAYFRRLAQCLSKARHSILIVGWDFDAGICLERGANECTLGAFLRALVEERSELHVRILIWSTATVHGPGATLPLLIGDSWSAHPRIRVELDKVHPFYGSHHQKIVSIDDQVAFTGGIDLTVDRWDTPAHELDNAERVKPDGTPYEPVHDVQMILEGAAAHALGDVARARWQAATGEEIAPGNTAPHDLWPVDLDPQFTGIPIAISRVEPCWHGRQGCSESFNMTIDAIGAAKNSIYLEAQYFTSRRVGAAIARSLAEPVGPEIVVVVGMNSHGWFERYVMGNNRDRLARKLRMCDVHDRFRIFSPIIACKKYLIVHSKLITVDDTFLRIGSSNLNNRSEGLDTECDVAIDACDSHTCLAIAKVRDALLAEHLGTHPEIVRSVVSEERSLIRAIDRLNRNARRLAPLPGISKRGPTRPVFGTRLLDPSRPWH